MRRTTEQKQRGIEWDLTRKLEDLDFADDVFWHKMTEKLVDIDRETWKVGMKINQAKTKVMNMNNKTKNNFTPDKKEIGNVDKFPYLGSRVVKEGGSVEDVRNEMSKANWDFNQQQKVWKSSDIPLRTKLRIFNSNVK
jgi:hypothetical protein